MFDGRCLSVDIQKLDENTMAPNTSGHKHKFNNSISLVCVVGNTSRCRLHLNYRWDGYNLNVFMTIAELLPIFELAHRWSALKSKCLLDDGPSATIVIIDIFILNIQNSKKNNKYV